LAAGGYHFAKLNHEPWAEADNFLSQLAKGGHMDLPCVLDYEEDGSPDTTQWLLSFLRQMEAETGKIPVLYTGSWRLKALSGPVDQLAKFRYWIPGWSEQPTFYGPYENWAAWQWTNKGKVSGISGNVDRDWILETCVR
jgi:lysozyme